MGGFMSIALFDWEARWESEVLPVLDHPKVQQSIAKYKKERGKYRAPLFRGTTPFLPYQCGREPQRGWQVYTATELGAYCPIGACHGIHLFCRRVGEQFYPGLRWGTIVGDVHTVAVGCVPGEQG